MGAWMGQGYCCILGQKKLGQVGFPTMLETTDDDRIFTFQSIPYSWNIPIIPQVLMESWLADQTRDAHASSGMEPIPILFWTK